MVLLLAALIYIPTLFSPHLMDDTDAVNAQIPRNMLTSGDLGHSAFGWSRLPGKISSPLLDERCGVCGIGRVRLGRTVTL